MTNKVQKPCKICGKMFTPCADCENDKAIFHWRRVACSRECAKQYFAKIEASRQSDVNITMVQAAKIENVKTTNTTLENTNVVKYKKTKKKIIKNENEESEQID